MNFPFVRRPLLPGETDHEAIWLSVSLAGSIILGMWLWMGGSLPHCLVMEFFGVPCPGCGGTRALHSLMEGRLVEAFAWNPTVAGGLVIFNMYAVITLLLRLPRWRPDRITRRQATWIRIAAAAILGMHWLYLAGQTTRLRGM
jgi:hypothetical protein